MHDYYNPISPANSMVKKNICCYIHTLSTPLLRIRIKLLKNIKNVYISSNFIILAYIFLICNLILCNRLIISIMNVQSFTATSFFLLFKDGCDSAEMGEY